MDTLRREECQPWSFVIPVSSFLPVVPRYQRPKDELHNVQPHPYRKKCSYRNLHHSPPPSALSQPSTPISTTCYIPPTHIKTIPKLQLLPLPRLRKQPLLSPPPRQPRYPRPQQSTDEEKRRCRYEQRHGQEVHEHEEEGQSYGCAGGVRVRYSPGYACEEHEEGEQVREGGVGAVPGVFRFCGGGW